MQDDSLGLARRALELRPYAAEWVRSFEAERDAILEQLPNVVLEVEHIGSTSVPGLAAKPIIDMQAALRDLSDSERVFPGFVELGYAFMPDRVYERRIFLPKGPEGQRTPLPFSHRGRQRGMAHPTAIRGCTEVRSETPR